MQKFYTMEKNDRRVDILIYGDITSWRWCENDVSGFSFAKDLANCGDADEIVVHINSYGGEVSEGFAIYNLLHNHKAKVTTICDGFACSAASLIFMAGGHRIMNPASALWIHNVQVYTGGDGNAHRKAAEEADMLTTASKTAYTAAGLSIDDETLAAMMDAETWIMPEDAVRMGFATEIAAANPDETPTQCARDRLFALLQAALALPKSPDDERPPVTVNTGEDVQPKFPDEKAAQKWSSFFHTLMNIKEGTKK